MWGFQFEDFPDVSWTMPAAFTGSASLCDQAEAWQLTRLQGDFVRCLAASAWTMRHEIRIGWLGLLNYSMLDDCLLAGLRQCGWPLRSLVDDAFVSCWNLRVEFVAARAGSSACYRAGASYHDRLGLHLLLHSWQRLSFGEVDAEIAGTICAKLAESSAAFSPRLALPIGLLRRVFAERRAESDAERGMQEKLRSHLSRFATDDVRRLAISRALGDTGALKQALWRFGTAPMRKLLQRHLERSFPTRARQAFEPFRLRLYRELWAPPANDED